MLYEYILKNIYSLDIMIFEIVDNFQGSMWCQEVNSLNNKRPLEDDGVVIGAPLSDLITIEAANIWER